MLFHAIYLSPSQMLWPLFIGLMQIRLFDSQDDRVVNSAFLSTFDSFPGNSFRPLVVGTVDLCSEPFVIKQINAMISEKLVSHFQSTYPQPVA